MQLNRVKRQLLVDRLTSARQPTRSLIRVVEFFKKKTRDIVYEPLLVVYRKDGVSRARNVLVYKSDHNIVIPCLNVAGIFVFLASIHHVYRNYYLTPPKRDPEIYGDEDPVMNLIPLLGGIAWTVFVSRFITRYVTRVYYNDAKKEFTLVTYNLIAPFFTMPRVVRAGSGRVIEKDKNHDPEFIWNPIPRVTYNCTVDGSKYLLHPEYFKYPVYFNVLFGYDDPEAITKLEDNDTTADRIFKERAEDKFY